MNKYLKIGMVGLFLLGFRDLPAQAATPAHPFMDLKGSFAEEAVSSLYQQGMIRGVTEDRYAPDQTISRKHFSLLLSKALGIQPLNHPVPSFTDLPVKDPALGYVEALHQLGLINGITATQFAGDKPISRQDVAVILHRALQDKGVPLTETTLTYKDESTISSYAREAVQFITSAGIMKGNQDMFYPAKTLSRAEAAVLIKRIYDLSVEMANQEWSYHPDKITLKPGESQKIELTPPDQAVSYLPVWGFDHSTIGSISEDGVFTALQPGSGVISLNIGNKTYPIPVEVSETVNGEEK